MGGGRRSAVLVFSALPRHLARPRQIAGQAWKEGARRPSARFALEPPPCPRRTSSVVLHRDQPEAPRLCRPGSSPERDPRGRPLLTRPWRGGQRRGLSRRSLAAPRYPEALAARDGYRGERRRNKVSSILPSVPLPTHTDFWKAKKTARQAGEVGSIPGYGSSPGGGNGIPFRYSCLENPMDRGAWQATVHRVAASDKT